MTSIAAPRAVLRELDDLIAAFRAVQPGTPRDEPHLSELLDRQSELGNAVQDSSRCLHATEEEMRQISYRYFLLMEALQDIRAGGFWRVDSEG